jgi:hypothetical protein
LLILETASHRKLYNTFLIGIAKPGNPKRDGSAHATKNIGDGELAQRRIDPINARGRDKGSPSRRGRVFVKRLLDVENIRTGRNKMDITSSKV